MWNEYPLIMLPTDLQKNFHPYLVQTKSENFNVGDDLGELSINNNSSWSITADTDILIPQDLYIIGDKPTNDDNQVVIFKSSNGLITCLAGKGYGRVKTMGEYYPIVATTNESLELPLISLDYKEYYMGEWNKGNKIEKVVVEYKYTIDKSLGHFHQRRKYFLSLNNNVVNIRKNSEWDKREELYGKSLVKKSINKTEIKKFVDDNYSFFTEDTKNKMVLGIVDYLSKT
jgi:hypothetical protein